MENNFVLRQLPYGIHTNWIWRTDVTVRRSRIQVEFGIFVDITQCQIKHFPTGIEYF